MIQNLPLPAAQEFCNSSSGVTPCIVMKNNGVLYHQVSSLDEDGVAGTRISRQSLPSALEVQHGVVLPPSISYATMKITFTAYYVGHTFFGRGEPGCFHSFDWCFEFGSLSEPRFCP